MSFIFFFFMLFCLLTAKYKNPFNRYFHEDFLDYNNTKMLNGIFVFLVFMSHFSGYVQSFYIIDSIYLKFNRFLGECIVCPFLFYSGYGMMEQIKKKGNIYLHKLICKRFISIWIKFGICVLLYIILSFIMKEKLTISQVLFSLVGLASVGNSAWYIFYILFSYLAIYFSFRFFNNQKLSLIFLFLIFILYTITLVYIKRDSPEYYLVSMVLPTGMMFSYLKDKISSIFIKNWFINFIAFFILYITSFIIRHLWKLGGWSYNITAVFFSILLLLITMKIKFQNRLLNYLGNHIFEIYILQRIPMIALKPLFNSINNIYCYFFYFAGCLLITLLLLLIVNHLFKIIRL